jgi:hypothetical protein
MEHSLKRSRDQQSEDNASSSRAKHFADDDTSIRVKAEEVHATHFADYDTSTRVKAEEVRATHFADYDTSTRVKAEEVRPRFCMGMRDLPSLSARDLTYLLCLPPVL